MKSTFRSSAEGMKRASLRLVIVNLSLVLRKTSKSFQTRKKEVTYKGLRPRAASDFLPTALDTGRPQKNALEILKVILAWNSLPYRASNQT